MSLTAVLVAISNSGSDCFSPPTALVVAAVMRFLMEQVLGLHQ